MIKQKNKLNSKKNFPPVEKHKKNTGSVTPKGTRRKLIGLAILFFLISYPLFPGKADLKNIIIIAVDTLRADHVGCYGYPLPTTPGIDKFAEDGVIFKNAYAPTPLTGPSFATMMTSLPPYKHGARRNGLPIFDNIKTLAWYLKKFGYRTAAFISNWPLKRKLSDLHRGFDLYYEILDKRRYYGILNSEGRAPDVNELAFDWLEKHHKKRFFIWVQYSEPHSPYVLHKEFKIHGKKIDTSLYPPGTRYGKIKKYDSEIAFTDFHIGELLKKIKDLELYRDSLIIFVSDHGESFGEHDYFKHGRNLYNSTLHVALIVKLPGGGSSSNRSRDDNVSVIDLTPTVFSVLKLPIPEYMEGTPLFKEPGNKKREIYFETYRGNVLFKKKLKAHLKVHPIKYGILKGSTKIIFNDKNGKYEAYHLEADRFETKNLLNPSKGKFPVLEKLLSGFMNKVKKYIEATSRRFKRNSRLSEEDIEVFKSLGYIH